MNMELPEHFWSKVSKSDGCWTWTGSLTTRGYGQFGVSRVMKTAHRLSFESAVGPIPDGLELDHLCRNRACVRPDHLQPVTHAENVRRGDLHRVCGDKTHCKHGHEFTPENTYIGMRPGGGVHRGCRHCGRIKMRNRAARARAEALT